MVWKGVDVTAANATDVDRLVALVARQRRELDLMRAQAAKRSVVDSAQGMLMERLGCSSAEASQQLVHLAHESGTPLSDLAAELTGQHLAVNGARNTVGPDTDGADAGGADAGGAVTGGAVTGGEGWRGLGLASAALQMASEGDAVAAVALEQVLAPAGAHAVGLWLAGPDGILELAGQAGLGAAESARWRYVPPAMDCALQRVIRADAPLFWPAGRPEGDVVPVTGPWPRGARAVLLLPGPGMSPGVMEVCWQDPLDGFDAPLRRQLAVLADLCSHALRPGPASDHRMSWLYGLLDGVIESALVAHPVSDESGQVIDFRIRHVTRDFRDPGGRAPSELVGRPLLELYPLAAQPGGLFDLAVHVLSTGEPSHASGAVLATPEAGTTLADIRAAPLSGGVVIAWRRVDEAERLASLLQHAERLGRIGGWEEDLLTEEIRWTESACGLFGRSPGEAISLADLHLHVLTEDVADVKQFRDTLMTDQTATAAAFRILRADDESIRQMRVFAEPVTDHAGALVTVRGAFQDVSASYHTQVALSATRDRLADTEERAEEEHRLALRLQQAITPSSPQPVAAAGLDVAARYRPAGPEHLVSGDWYDTVLLPTGQVLVVVGDIAGHGIDAVTGMVELRNCLRGLAITGAGPATLLRWLNQVACELTNGTIGTALCGLYDPAGRILRWSRAGHLPPVLVRDGRARDLPSGDAVLLGASPGARYEEVTTRLVPGDVLLLYTDGLIECRDQPIDEAIASLIRIASRPVAHVADYADTLMRHAASDTGDDACLVAVHVR